MAIVTLLEHLKNTQKRFNVSTDTFALKNVSINEYVVSENSLLIFTDQNHEIQIDISDFKEIIFDAIVWNAATSIEMKKCFHELADSKKYNAYLKGKKDKYLLNFNRIPSEY